MSGYPSYLPVYWRPAPAPVHVVNNMVQPIPKHYVLANAPAPVWQYHVGPYYAPPKKVVAHYPVPIMVPSTHQVDRQVLQPVQVDPMQVRGETCCQRKKRAQLGKTVVVQPRGATHCVPPVQAVYLLSREDTQKFSRDLPRPHKKSGILRKGGEMDSMHPQNWAVTFGELSISVVGQRDTEFVVENSTRDCREVFCPSPATDAASYTAFDTGEEGRSEGWYGDAMA